MSNVPASKSKSPWIPPPGRVKRTVRTAVQCPTNPQKFKESDSCSRHNDDPISLSDAYEREDDVASLSSVLSCDNMSNEMRVNLSSIKKEMKLLTIHFMTLKQMAQFLNRIFVTLHVEDSTVQDVLKEVDDEINKFIVNSGDLEYSVTLVENTIHPDAKFEEYVKTLVLRENLSSKLLDCYSKTLAISQSLLQTHNADENLKKEHELIQKQYEQKEREYFSQDVIIQDLRKKASILQGKLNTLESYKTSSESMRTELQKQLSYKEAQIQYLQSELPQVPAQKSDDNEKLLIIIEELRNKASAEKVALKKALKSQKLTLEKINHSNEKLQRVMDIKNSNMAEIATQRDKLKFELTVARNNIIENKNKLAEMNSQNLKLQKELNEIKSDFKKEIEVLSKSVEEKTTELSTVLQEKVKLEKSTEEAKHVLEQTRRELNNLRSAVPHQSEVTSEFGAGGDCQGASDNVKCLISLLQDTQKELKCFKRRSSVQADAIHSLNESPNILKTMEEIKENLLDLKNLHNDSPLSLAKRENHSFSKRNEALMTEINELKSQRKQNSHLIENEGDFSTHSTEKELLVQKLKMELALKTEESKRLKDREKDLEQHLQEVKDKLHKMEREHVRCFSLEEELKMKKNELSLLEKHKDEEHRKFTNRIKEMQDMFNETSAELESLKRYVEILRTSYRNVFGNT